MCFRSLKDVPASDNCVITFAFYVLRMGWLSLQKFNASLILGSEICELSMNYVIRHLHLNFGSAIYFLMCKYVKFPNFSELQFFIYKVGIVTSHRVGVKNQIR